MVSGWSDFFVATGGAAAALTGLLFIAVSVRPREIRESHLMHGRARSAFYAFATITIVSMLALAGTPSAVIGLAQLGVAVEVLVASTRFTMAARRARTLNYARATVYHAGLLVTGGGGAIRALGGDSRDYSAVLGFGVLLLLGIAMSNSWQLVISHDPPADDQRA